MDKRLQQAVEILKKEMEKDQREIQNHKKKMIDEIKTIDKSTLFKPKEKKKVSIIDKILKILGYGKKR
jgi:cysteine sulfinate desulfinase/cysteine desulfurase-like protein